MSILRRGEPLGAGAPRRYRIRIITQDGRTFYWHKRGQVHTLEEDVATTFVAHFNPQVFQVREDGTLGPPVAGETIPIRSVEKELV